MTSNKEDYLKVIYEEGGAGRLVPNKVLSEKLGIAPASVSEMLAKLCAQGLIEYQAYKGSRLTEQGVLACLAVVRSHRLWEVFLMQHLGYSWREAHEDAHLLEHAAPARMVERLDAFLNYPKTCPHGSVIPPRGEVPVSTQVRRLSQLQPGEQAVVYRVEEDGELLDYLEKSGLLIGQEIQVLAVGDYEGPICFRQGGRKLQISYKAAVSVYVIYGRDQEMELRNGR